MPLFTVIHLVIPSINGISCIERNASVKAIMMVTVQVDEHAPTYPNALVQSKPKAFRWGAFRYTPFQDITIWPLLRSKMSPQGGQEHKDLARITPFLSRVMMRSERCTRRFSQGVGRDDRGGFSL